MALTLVLGEQLPGRQVVFTNLCFTGLFLILLINFHINVIFGKYLLIIIKSYTGHFAISTF